MAGRKDNMKAIKDEIDRLRVQRDALTNKIEGLEAALRLVSGEAAELRVSSNEKQRRGDVKNTVLSVVSDAADAGVTVTECMQTAAAKHGIMLDRGSVSSLLSRLKRDNVLFYDGDRYRLKQYAGPRSAA